MSSGENLLFLFDFTWRSTHNAVNTVRVCKSTVSADTSVYSIPIYSYNASVVHTRIARRVGCICLCVSAAVLNCVRMCTTISLLQQHIEKQLNSTSSTSSSSGNESWVRFVVVCYCYRELLTLCVDIFRVYIYLFIHYYVDRFVSPDNVPQKMEKKKPNRFGQSRKVSSLISCPPNRSPCTI